MTSPSPLQARITDRYPTLTPQERQAADTLLTHIEDLATYRATELADLAGVSKATMSRLVRRLGYDDFDSLREHLRTLRQDGLPVATGPTPGLSAHVAQDIANLHRLQATLDETVLDTIGEAVARARRVFVSGHRSSYAIATVLRMNLAQIRPDTRLVPQPGQSAAEDVLDAGPDDLVIVVSFRRHSPRVRDLLAVLRAAQAQVLLIADSQLRSMAHDATWWIECPATTTGAFDSHASALSLVAMLSDRVLDWTPDGQERIERVDSSYRALHDIDDT